MGVSYGKFPTPNPTCATPETPVTDSLPLLAFVFAGLFSPGPNVVMLTASGARFGFSRTLPHLLGVPVGVAVLAAISGLGIGTSLMAMPSLKLVFQLLAAIWILWLAFKTARAGRAGRASDTDRPFTFLQAITFQVVNPKVWAVAIAAAAGFGVGLSPALEALRLGTVFLVLNTFVCLFWTSAGHLLSNLLQSDTSWRRFMSVMALIMASTVVLIFI